MRYLDTTAKKDLDMVCKITFGPGQMALFIGNVPLLLLSRRNFFLNCASVLGGLQKITVVSFDRAWRNGVIKDARRQRRADACVVTFWQCPRLWESCAARHGREVSQNGSSKDKSRSFSCGHIFLVCDPFGSRNYGVDLKRLQKGVRS